MRILALTLTLAVASIAALSVPAMAGPHCTSESRDKWLTEEAMKAKISTLGYERIRAFKVSGNCYEIYGYTKDGQKAEVYFNPVNGEIVKSSIGG